MAVKEKKPRKARKPRTKKPKTEKAKASPDDYDKLFNFTKIFFGNNPKYHDVTNYQKKKHRFMMNRFMAIRYPDTAERFNVNKINPVAVINLWRIVGRKYNRTPQWFWTKTKKPKEKKSKTFVPSEDTVKFYLRKQQISQRDLNDAMKFHEDEILEELERIEKTIEENE